MGLDELKPDDSEQNKNEIVSISSDQMYVTDKKEDQDSSKTKSQTLDQGLSSSTESAAITMAKQAAESVISTAS